MMQLDDRVILVQPQYEDEANFMNPPRHHFGALIGSSTLHLFLPLLVLFADLLPRIFSINQRPPKYRSFVAPNMRLTEESKSEDTLFMGLVNI